MNKRKHLRFIIKSRVRSVAELKSKVGIWMYFWLLIAIIESIMAVEANHWPELLVVEQCWF